MPKLSFNAIQKLDLPLTEIVSGRIAFIHDFFLTFPYEVSDDLPDEDRDLVVLIGKKERGERIEELGSHPGRVVLVVAPGDASFRNIYLQGRRGLPPNFVAAFVTNNELADKRAFSIPLGVRTNKLLALQFVRQNRSGQRGGLLYGNFTVNEEHYRRDKAGEPHVRARLVSHLQNEPWATLDVSAVQRDTPDELIHYYSQIASHRFVLSPEGNGVDCYRTWEALYLGAIPIVMASPAMSAFADLPILLTDDYSELSSAYLERRWLEMSQGVFDVNLMLKSYYFQRFLAAIGMLQNPRFLCWRFDSDKFRSVLALSSHSPAGVLAETPTAPFTPRYELINVDAWHTPGGLRMEMVADGLRITAEGEGPMVAETPLTTIAGGPFRLTGSIRAESRSAGGLRIALEERPEVIATVEAGAGAETFELNFVARSPRTVLSISALEPNSKASWLLTGLAVQANL